MGLRGPYKKVLTIGTCRTCGNSFEYMRGNIDKGYCTDTCKRRMKIWYEQQRRDRLGIGNKPLRAPTPKRKLIPYAGKE